MSVTGFPQVRLAAAIALVAALGLAIGLFTLSHSQASTQDVATPLRVHAPKHATNVANPVQHVHKRPRATVVRHPKRVATTNRLAAENGLPVALSWALRRHRIVVVSLYARGGVIDRDALAEARAGAALAGAGFVAVDVLQESQTRRMTGLLNGRFEDPAVLVVNRPGSILARLDGFADRETVAQAASNARP